MALVKCPECGQENVSITAESYPNCHAMLHRKLMVNVGSGMN